MFDTMEELVLVHKYVLIPMLISIISLFFDQRRVFDLAQSDIILLAVWIIIPSIILVTVLVK